MVEALGRTRIVITMARLDNASRSLLTVSARQGRRTRREDGTSTHFQERRGSTLKLGQKAVARPETLVALSDKGKNKVAGAVMTGRIQYIHPEMRFVTIEFECRGGRIRESFPPEEVRVV